MDLEEKIKELENIKELYFKSKNEKDRQDSYIKWENIKSNRWIGFYWEYKLL